jgi:hypothetical protein
MWRNGSDRSWDYTVTGSSLQYTFLLHIRKDLQLQVKMYPHRTSSQAPSFRMESYKSRGDGNRGTRLTCREFVHSETLRPELERYFSELLTEHGV